MSKWENPPDAVWVWGKYGTYRDTYCHAEEIKQEEFEIPVTKYVRADRIAALEAQLAERVNLSELIKPLEGYDTNQSGYTHRKGWNDAIMHVMDLTRALEATPPAPKVTEAPKIDDAVAGLFVDAWAEAEKAMRKFPQPNYVISKVAEEAGEVVKAAIHCAEGRETAANVVAEIKQAMAMLIRLYVEGDQVHGLPPLTAAQEAGKP
jgi:hypothetical protein